MASIEAIGIPPRIILVQSLLKVKDEVIPNDILEKINDSCYFTSLLFMEVANPKIFKLLANAGTVKNTLDIIRSWNKCARLMNTPVSCESTEDRKSDSICRKKVAEYLLKGKANSGEGDDSEVKTLPESVLNGLDEGTPLKNLFLKSDINTFLLINFSCHPESKERFNYKYELDKDCLFYNGESLLYNVLKYADRCNTDEASFEMALRICLQKLDLDFGGLLLDDEAPYQLAVDKFGKRNTFKIIKRCIPANTNIPVLHQVIEYTPEYLTDFASRYPSTIFLRDNDGRAFHHVALTSFDSDAFEENPMIFLQLSDEQIEDKDPELDLYPFMCAASNYHIDLTSIYYLLRRCPSVLDESRRMGIDDKEVLSMNILKNEVSKKRKRGCA